MRVTLEIVSGVETGRKAWLRDEESLVVGRTERSEFVVPSDPLLSGRHFRLVCQQGTVLLQDLNSTNGTFVNGERKEICTLGSGDFVLAGETQFQVSVAELPSLERTNLADEESTQLPDQRPEPTSTTVAEYRIPAVPLTENSHPDHPSVHPTFVYSEAEPAVVSTQEVLAEDAGLEEPESEDTWLEIHNQTPFAVECLPWENAAGEARLTVVVKVTLSLSSFPAVLAGEQLPISHGDVHEEDDPLLPVRLEADTARFKPAADIVLVGHVYSPGGRPRTWVDARLRVGSVQKRLRVFGDRHWLYPTRFALVPQMTDPEPFARMPLTYRRAYGGIDEPAGRYFADNPLGVGFIGEPSPASIHRKPLPNIEDPECLIRSWDTRPPVVGFGFVGRGSQSRLRWAGTYDEAYRSRRAPLPPLDESHEFANGAHPDLQVRGYLDGDESIELDNLTPDGSVRTALPGIYPTLELSRRVTVAVPASTTGKATTKKLHVEAPVRPFFDTLVLLPDEQQAYLLFRAVFAMSRLDACDIATVRVT